MRTIELVKVPIELERFKARDAAEEDITGEHIDESCIFQIDGRTVGAYIVLPTWDGARDLDRTLDAIERAVREIRYSLIYRTGGLKTHSRTIGYSPRIPIRNNWCSASILAAQQPKAHATVLRGAEIAERAYAAINAPLFDEHRTLAAKVLPDWRIGGAAGVFTSGIVNENSQLRYHFDGGNFKNVWSGMLAFRQGMIGGRLNFPEYNVSLGIADRSLLLFDGQGILHGVTPFSKLFPDAYRVTIVYYSLRGMWNCEPFGQEIERIRARRTDYEERRAKQKPGDVKPLHAGPWKPRPTGSEASE